MTMVLGIDEVGTGAWASDIYLAGVAMPEEVQESLIKLGVMDSKQLSPEKRMLALEIAALYTTHTYVEKATVSELWDVGHAVAYARAVERILRALPKKNRWRIIIDGDPIKQLDKIHRQQPLPYWDRIEFIRKADTRYASVAAASNLAKVLRDGYMDQLHEIYPEYMWNNNKGYGTFEHSEAVNRMGVTKYHRKVRSLLGAPERKA